MSSKVAVEVSPNIGALTAGILRAVLYPEDEAAKRKCVDAFGVDVLREAIRRLPEIYARGGVLITDCAAGDDPWQSDTLIICPCDTPHCATIHRSSEYVPDWSVLPAFPHWRWPGNRRGVVVDSKFDEVIRIGFMGRARPEIRRRSVEVVRQWSRDDPGVVFADIVEREQFLGQEVGRETARSEYVLHMLRNDYQICARGVGAYCYRLYETLSLGRIPIVVGQRALPWSDRVNWSYHAVLVTEPEDIPAAVLNWRDGRDVAEVMESNRRMWWNLLSPVGWWSEIAAEIGRIYQ